MKTNLTILDIAVWCGFITLAASMMVTPLCLPEISAGLDFSFTGGGALETAKTIIVLIILFVSGFLAGRWGKKPFLTLGQYIMAAGLFLTSFAGSYVMLVASLMITGIGSGLAEALLNPLMPDIHPVETGKYLNISNAFFSIGVMVCSLLFGELLTLGISWRWIFRFTAGAALATGIFLNLLRFPPAENGQESSWKAIGTILKEPLFWLFAVGLFLGGGAEAAFTFWSRSYINVYLNDLPRAGAFAVMLFAGAMAAGRLISARLSRRFSLLSIMIGSAVLGLCVSFFIPVIRDLFLLYVLIGLSGLATACLWPSILADADQTLKKHSTLLLILLAAAGACGFGLVTLSMGALGDAAGLQNSFYIIPGLFLLLILVLATTGWARRRR